MSAGRLMGLLHAGIEAYGAIALAMAAVLGVTVVALETGVRPY